MILFKRSYGDTPLHLIASIASFALAGYAFVQIFDGSQAWNIILWFVGAILVHDLVFWPLYTGLNAVATLPLGAGRADRPPVRGLNHVRVPVVISGVLFVAWFPLILGLDSTLFERSTTLSTDVYLGRWLAITAGLFVLSGLAFAVRMARARGQAAPGDPADA
jgi:hypothetical protein